MSATQITTLTGSNVPFTKKTGRLDEGFTEQVAWLRTKLGIDNPEGIHITVVTNGNVYRAPLTAAQLLGHTLASVLQLSGAEDLEDSHSLVFIVRCPLRTIS